MKIAYCIQCHKNSKILRETISQLHEYNDIYIHVDKKSEIREFDEYVGKVTFIKERTDVKWGDFSQVEATLSMLKEVNKYEYDYISLISGDCLILRKDKDIKKILCLNNGKEFIGIEKQFDNDELTRRIKYEYNNLYYKKNHNIIEKIILKISNFIGKKKINIYYENLPQLYKGCQWFTITSQLSKYFIKYLDENPKYLLAFKKSLCSDEVFFQTIVMNSHYSNNIFKIDDESDDNLMAMRYIDWESGPQYPKILCECDFDKIRQNRCIIGRKFNEDIDIDLYRKFLNS